MPAGLNERCGWCAYHVPQGAHICGACGAIRIETEEETPLSHQILNAVSGGIIGAFIGFIIMLFIHEPKIVLFSAFLFAYLNVVINKTMPNVQWFRQ